MSNIFTLKIEIERIKYEVNWNLNNNIIRLYVTDISSSKVLFDKLVVNVKFTTIEERINYIKSEIIPLFEAVG